MAPAPHPARTVLFDRQIKQTEVARKLGVSPFWLNRALGGYVPTTFRLRNLLSEWLGLPEADLFLKEDPSRGVTLPRSAA